MSDRVLLVEIGTAAALPAISPPPASPPSSWVPSTRPTPGLPAPTNLASESMADAARLTWTPSAMPGTTSVIEAAPDDEGVPGAWLEVDRTGADNYTIALPGGPGWVRLKAALNGIESAYTIAVPAIPLSVSDLSEAVQETQDDIAQALAALDQEVIDRIAGDGAEAAARASALADEAAARSAEIQATADALWAQVGDLTEADVHDPDAAYDASELVQSGGKLYRSLQAVPAGQSIPITDTTYWKFIGNYTSLGEAVGANAQAVFVHDQRITDNEDGISTLNTDLTALTSEVAGKASTAALNALTTRVTTAEGEIDANTSAITSLNTTVAGKASTTALNALTTRVTTAEGEIDANTSAITSLNTTVAGKASTTALNALTTRVTDNEDGLEALSSDLAVVNSRVGSAGENIVLNPGFEENDPDFTMWADGPTGGAWNSRFVRYVSSSGSFVYSGNSALRIYEAAGGMAISLYNRNTVPARGGDKAIISYKTGGFSSPTAGSTIRVGLRCMDQAGAYLANTYGSYYTSTGSSWTMASTEGNIVNNKVTLPAGTRYVVAFVYCSGLESGNIFIDDIDVRLETSDGAAQASAISALETRATSIEGVNTSQAASITSLTASANTASASITMLNQVSAAAMSGNMVADPGFELPNSESHWTYINAAASTATAKSGARCLLLSGTSTSTATANHPPAPVRVGQMLGLSFWARRGTTTGLNGVTRLYVRWYNANGSVMSSDATQCVINNSVLSTTFVKVTGQVVVPAGAAFCSFNVYSNNTVTDGNVYVDDIQATAMSDALESAYASVGVTLNVSGYITGYQQINNGATGEFSVLADKFGVVNPGGGAAMTWEDGVLWNRGTSHSVIVGQSFGISGDLLMWAGPNVANKNQASKANGVFWLDNTGDAYFGGTLSAGVLKNAASSSQISATAQADTGAFGTNGSPKVITYGMSFVVGGQQNTDAGGSTPSGTIVLERSLNDGTSWTQVSSASITGNRTSVYNSELGKWQVNVNAAASSTFTDNNAGTGNFRYRARITAANWWPYTVASVPPNAGTQRTYVISVEE